MLHLIDIKKYKHHPRAFWLSRCQKGEFVPLVNYNESVSELVEQLLTIREENAFVRQADGSGESALQVLYEKKVSIHVHFVYESLRISIPFLIQEDGRRIPYLTYRSYFPKKHEAVRTAQYLMVLGELGVSVDAVYAIHPNTAYVRGEELNVEQLLIVNEYLYNGKNKVYKAVRELLGKQEIDLDAMLEELHAYEAMDDTPVKRSRMCTCGGKCTYYDDYFSGMPVDNSTLDLVQTAQKYEMCKEGITTLRDTDIDRIEGTRHQCVQIMTARNHGLYVDKGALRCWKKAHIQTPAFYLDFE